MVYQMGNIVSREDSLYKLQIYYTLSKLKGTRVSMKKIKNIVEKLKYKMCNNMGEISCLFNATTKEQIEVMSDLFKTYSKSNSVYDESELVVLLDYSVPQIVIDFYNDFSVIDGADLDGDVNLLSLEAVKYENSELTPGALLIKYGLITIATTTGGNAICLDLNKINNSEPRVVIADCTIFNDKIITTFNNGVITKEELSYEVIEKYVVEINSSFTGFLEMLLNDEIDDVEEYLD